MPLPPDTTPPRGQELKRAVDRYLSGWEDLGTFSGAVLLARGDTVLLARGYGLASQELGVPNTADTKFRIASVSKPFTEVALARLVADGKLTLDTRLSRFAPAYPPADSITIRMLMEHRAGVPSMNAIPYHEDAVPSNTLDSLVHLIEKQPLDFPPGSRRSYSNGGYALLAHVIERASGESYGEYLQRAVLDPLGLKDTGSERDLEVVDGLASGYEPSPTRRGRSARAPYQQMATKEGGGSLYSTVGDLFRFSRAMYHDNVIPAARWRELFSPQHQVVEFEGRCPGYMALVRKSLDPDLTVIVLANNYAAMVGRIADGLAALARGRSPEPVPWRADLHVDSSTLTSYAGAYVPPKGALPFLPAGTPAQIGLRQGSLVLTLTNTPVDVLLPQSDSTFLLRNLWAMVAFHRSQGRMTGLTYSFLFRSGGFDARRR